MFRRGETARERVLLRIVERQERQIADLIDRLMYVNGTQWMPPPPDPDADRRADERQRRLDEQLADRLTWTASPEQEPI